MLRGCRMLGENVRLTGFKGGETGNWLESQLKKLGVVTRFVEVSGETRTNNNIIDRVRDSETEVLEPGPFISGEDMEKFMEVYKEALSDSKVVVLSGGLPRECLHAVIRLLLKRQKTLIFLLYLTAAEML